MIKIINVWTTDFNLFVDDIVNNIESITMVILDCLNEADHYDRVFNKQEIDRLLSITFQHNVSVKILTSNPNKNSVLNQFPNVTVISWDTFWFGRTYRVWAIYDKYDEQKINQAKGINIKDDNVCKNFELLYPYICLNNIVKNHRCLVMDMLAKHDLISHGKISWRNISYGRVDVFDFQYWKPEILILDQDLNTPFKQETMPIEFNNSFMQLVTETEDTDTFITEKTVTPIFLNKIFLVAANRGFHRVLEQKGFKLYTELFDYSFDDEFDINVRYEKIIENVKRYVGLSPIELKQHYDSVVDKITHNRKLAIEYASVIPNEITELHLLINKNNTEYTGPLNNIKSIE